MKRYLSAKSPGGPEHLLAVWQRATPEVRAAGAAWYDTARQTLQEIADEFGLTLRQVAGVTAVLSPSLSWDQNLTATRELLAGHTSRGYGFNVEKAKLIVQGKDPDNIVSGPKVWAFYQNLMRLNSASPVIDRHMLRAWIGGSEPGAYGCSDATYVRATNDIITAAETVGVPVHEFQATVWLQIRKESTDGSNS